MTDLAKLDLYRNPEPVCPHCGYADRHWWDGAQWQDGDSREEECESCGEKYFVEASVDIAFTSAKKVQDL